MTGRPNAPKSAPSAIQLAGETMAFLFFLDGHLGIRAEPTERQRVVETTHTLMMVRGITALVPMRGGEQTPARGSRSRHSRTSE